MPFHLTIGPLAGLLGRLVDLHQRRRKVRLTMHQGRHLGRGPIPAAAAASASLSSSVAIPIDVGEEGYFLTVTNASRDRDIVVTHVWLDSKPPLHGA